MLKRYLVDGLLSRMFGLALLVLSLGCSQPHEVLYLDTDFPDLIPKQYARGIINLEGRFQQNLTMSPDGREHLITQTDAEVWRYERILSIRQEGKDIVIDTPQFVTEFSYKNEWFIGEPMLSPDATSLFFVADYPPSLWSTQRSGTGEWSKPERLPISTDSADWYPTFSRQDLFFTHGTMFACPNEGGKFRERHKVPLPHGDVRDPVMGPDGDFIIFAMVGDTTGQSDLYVSVLGPDQRWGAGQVLNDTINTPAYELGPYISPDGKYLFFSRRDSWQNATHSNIYWVSLKILEPYLGRSLVVR